MSHRRSLPPVRVASGGTLTAAAILAVTLASGRGDDVERSGSSGAAVQP
jgi:hypothetical protein